ADVGLGDGDGRSAASSIAGDQGRPREQGTDRPGRAFAAAPGGRRAAMEETNWHERGEEAFIGRFADTLGKLTAERGVDYLVLAAAPRALGVLRQKLPPAVSAIVQAELDSDFVNLPTPDIEKRLAAS
ncbi:host attachment protein, partial [Mycobacterium tuberculosis]|nr:host attachment protein [Mycobacterium tuberculosis]